MYTNTSESFNNLITRSGRTFRARILLGDNVLEGLSSIKTSFGSNNGEAMTLGSTISQQVEITMDTPGVSLAGQEFELQIGLKLDEENYEYIPMGLFTPEKLTNKQKKTSFAGYDRMMKLSGNYVSELADETDTVSVLNEISGKTGVPISTVGLSAIAMKKPVGYTYREALACIAQLYGCFANVNRTGTIELHFWEDTGYVLTADAGINGFEHGEIEFTVGKITCITSCDEVGNSNTITSGNGEKGIVISNEFMTQEIIDGIYEKINGFSYTPVKCPVILGDPRLEPWDFITIIDAEGNEYKTPIMNLSFEYDGGLSAEITSTVAEESEEENDYKGPMQQLQEKVQGLKTTLASFSKEIKNRSVGARNLIRNSRTLDFKDYYFDREEVVVAGVLLLSSDGYILKDSNGIYLTAKESE